MTPRMEAPATAPTARIPRGLFAHGHTDDLDEFPPIMFFNIANPIAYVLIPDNWNGIDALYAWFLGTETADNTYTFRLDIAKQDEAYTDVNETTGNQVISTVNTQYERIDLTVLLAVSIALITAGDIVRLTVDTISGDSSNKFIGLEIQES